MLLEGIDVHFFENEHPIGIRPVVFLSRWIPVDRERVVDPPDADILLERTIRRELGDNAEMSDAAPRRRFRRCDICLHRLRLVFDVADQARQGLGQSLVGAAVHRTHLDGGAIEPDVSGNLTDELRQAIDCQRGTVVSLSFL